MGFTGLRYDFDTQRGPVQGSQRFQLGALRVCHLFVLSFVISALRAYPIYAPNPTIGAAVKILIEQWERLR